MLPKVIKNTCSPDWNETFFFELAKKETTSLTAELLNWDFIGSAHPVGRLVIAEQEMAEIMAAPAGWRRDSSYTIESYKGGAVLDKTMQAQSRSITRMAWSAVPPSDGSRQPIAVTIHRAPSDSPDGGSLSTSETAPDAERRKPVLIDDRSRQCAWAPGCIAQMSAERRGGRQLSSRSSFASWTTSLRATPAPAGPCPPALRRAAGGTPSCPPLPRRARRERRRGRPVSSSSPC